tara:strand:- start:429 stop:677 length:249 start_codon:yes stop_codon:yes gene_type:complete
MKTRLKILFLSFTSSLIFLFVLCLGSQNLQDRKNLNLVFSETAKLPTGFLIGISLVIGIMSGGTAAAILLPISKDDSTEFNS